MRILLFSGHMVDRPGRAVARLPAAHVPAARRHIEAELQRLYIGAGDRAITSAASGGDLLFAQGCLARQAPVEVYLPYPRERFLQTSVLPGGAQWLDTFDAVLADPNTELHVLPEAQDDAEGGNAYARCNLVMLQRALDLAGSDVDLVCLWDGGEGDGPGGTAHMVNEVRRHGGRVHWIDTRTLADPA